MICPHRCKHCTALVLAIFYASYTFNFETPEQQILTEEQKFLKKTAHWESLVCKHGSFN